MSYQKCPICNGSGKVINTESTNMYDMCPVCKGARIIDEITGLPPYEFNGVIPNLSESTSPLVINAPYSYTIKCSEYTANNDNRDSTWLELLVNK
jgi:RecJ-like exonuclease